MACQGRCSATFGLLMIVGLLALLNLVAAAQTYKVGGDQGWTLPASANGLNYSDFMSKNTYYVGDVLEFTYNKDDHNILSVKPEDAYNSCNLTENVSSFEPYTGTTTITLKAPGMKYYACGFKTHCASGQKFAIMVQETEAPSPSPETNSASTLSFAIHSTVSAAIVLGASALVL